MSEVHVLPYSAAAYATTNDTIFPICRYKSDGANGKEREAVLEEDDELWLKIRHKHIADVLEYVKHDVF